MRMVPTQLTELPGEDLYTGTLTEVASWIAIYQELATVLQSVLARATDSDQAEALAANLAWIEDRLQRWRERHAALAGISIDPVEHRVTYAGRTAMLTRRETDLLGFLLQHPNRPFTCKQLASLAWNNPRLSDAQVRTYVMRLRRRLSGIGLQHTISVIGRRGYELSSPEPVWSVDGAL
jgi:DNA-binding response OmpR family regulator